MAPPPTSSLPLPTDNGTGVVEVKTPGVHTTFNGVPGTWRYPPGGMYYGGGVLTFYPDEATSEGAARLIQEARGYLGSPYLWGGNSGTGIDCSGLVQNAYKAVGINLPRTAQEMYSSGPGSRVSLANLQIGDLLFFGSSTSHISHVAIYIGNGMMIESAPSHGGVDIVKVTYQNNIIGAKRIGGIGTIPEGVGPQDGQYTGTGTSISAEQAAAANREAVNDIFQEYLGRDATSAEREMIIGGSWSADHVFRYIKTLPEWKGSPGWDVLRVNAESVWDQLVGGTMPTDLLEEAVNKGWTDQQIADRIRLRPEYKLGREYQTTKLGFIDQWEQRTGRDMSEAAKLALDKAINENWTMTQWDEYIESTPEYENGTEMGGKKASVLNLLDEMWGVGAVDDKLASDPDYVKNTVWKELGKDADAGAIERWARKQPEWMVGPQATASRVNLGAYYGQVMRKPMDKEALDQAVRDGLTLPQLLEQMRGTPDYKAWYAAMPAWMDEQEFNTQRSLFNGAGRWYFNNDSFQTSDGQLTYYFEHGITPQEVYDRYRWTEESTSQMGDTPGSWAYNLAAVGITLTPAMAYIMASRAEGSGALFAAELKGQNRRSFDQAFTEYTGHRPGEGDYAYLESNFVSATEYAKRMAAKEYSIEMFPQVNEIFRRVYGYEASLKDLEDVAMGAEGSGAYKALITAAEELDRYTLPWREYARTDPTPQQYAEWAGFAGPSELEKLLRARELVRSKGREMMDVYNSYWVMQGAPPISEQDLLTLEGQYMGWGAIDERLNLAAEHRQRQDNARSQWLASPPAQAYTVVTQFGGPQTPFLRRPQG